MSQEWTEIAMVVTSGITAAAAVFQAYANWNARPVSGGNIFSESQLDHKAAAREMPPVKDTADNGYLDELIKTVQAAQRAKHELFEKRPQKEGRAARNSLIGMIVTNAIAMIISGTYIRLFPSTGIIVVVPFMLIVLGASTLLSWRLFNSSFKNISSNFWKQGEAIEAGLEEALKEKVKASQFGPEMALALHDRLLEASPTVMPPMILISDRAIIAELARRADKRSVIRRSR